MHSIARMSLLDTFQREIAKKEVYERDRLGMMYRTPPIPEAAIVHRNASLFGYNRSSNSEESVCPCCQLPVNTVQVPFCSPTTPSSDQDQYIRTATPFLLESGASLFFTFIKLLLIYLGITWVIISLYGTNVSDINHDYCP